MAGKFKFDDAPLLAPGRHPMSLDALRHLCVDRFEIRGSRERLYAKLEEVIQHLLTAGVPCEILCNGSFLTERVDPADVDMVIRIDHDVSEAFNQEQRELIDALNEPEYLQGIDSFVDVVFPRGHPLFGLDESIAWEAHYGIEHSEKWLKGMAVIWLGETDVGLRFRR